MNNDSTQGSKMKTRNLLPLLLAGSMIVACGEAMDSDTPLDAENGLETLDAKADSFSVRPGSPEAEAVVAFANQALPNNASGTTFRDLLDSEMHKTAAKNIAKYRAGADGAFGTGDDKLFADLTALDKVPYVGRTALMQLLGLADAAGYLNRTSLDCADYIAHDRGNYIMRSYAELLEIENSRCTTIEGNLTIRIEGTDLLPPSARDIMALQHLTSVNGNISIYATPVFNSINFKSLEKVTGTVMATYGATPMHTLQFPALTEAPQIKLTGMKVSTFSKLEVGKQIVLENNDMTGFTALKTADLVDMTVRSKIDYDVIFPKLTEATKLDFDFVRTSSYDLEMAKFNGEFRKLTTVGSLSMDNGAYTNLKFTALKTVTGKLTSYESLDPFAGMSKLEHSGELISQNDKFTNQGVEGPKNIVSAGRIEIVNGKPVLGFNTLEVVETDVFINSTTGISGFNGLATVGGRITATIGGGGPAMFNGFNALTSVNDITVSAVNRAATIGASFGALQNIGSTLSITNSRGFDTDLVFPKLASVGGHVRIDWILGQHDVFPNLEIVDGSFSLNYVPSNFTGVNKLTHVEGDVSLGGLLQTMDGLKKLNSIGGDLAVARGFTGPNLDDFLNQLTEFSGSITFRN